MDAKDLLIGPRGRQPCAQLLGRDLGQLADTQSAEALLVALAATVSAAMYWHEVRRPQRGEKELMATLQAKRFESPDIYERQGKVETVELSGNTVSHATFERGWRYRPALTGPSPDRG